MLARPCRSVDPANWLTLAANVGVIAGIFFLALEIRQSNQIFGTFIAIQFVDSGVALIKGTDYFMALGVSYYIAQSLRVGL